MWYAIWCVCCAEYEFGDGIGSAVLAIFSSGVSFLPVKAIILAEASFAEFAALSMFLLLPLVEKHQSMSFLVIIPSIWFLKTFSYPKSFAIAVVTAESAVRDTAGRGGLLMRNLPRSSPAMCWQSDALPPLPQR